MEALGSYIIRLGIAHSVSVDTLMERVYLAYLKDNPHLDPSELRRAPNIKPSLLVRPNRTTLYTVNMLVHATGETNLRSGTFLAFMEAIKRSPRTFVDNMRWCPVCMLEFMNQGETGYFKLLWHLDDVTYCPMHRARLQSRCYRCNATQNSMARRRNCTTCLYCGEPLGRWTSVQGPKDRWRNQGADLIELVETIGRNPGLSFSASAVASVLQHPSNSEIAESIRKDEDRYVDYQGHVTFTRARRVAYRLGVRLSDLLAGDIEAMNRPLEPSWSQTLPDDMQPKPRRSQHDRKTILKRLSRVLSARGPKNTPSLEAFAVRQEVSVGYLHYQFPSLAKALIERHREWREERQHRRRLEARKAALTFFVMDLEIDEFVSKKGALAAIRTDTGLSKNLLREEIETVWQALARNPPFLVAARQKVNRRVKREADAMIKRLFRNIRMERRQRVKRSVKRSAWAR